MVKIYRVTTDHEAYALLPSDKKIFRKAKMFQLDRMLRDWDSKSEFYVRDPSRTNKENFFYLSPGTLVFDHEVYKSDLGEILARSGELLPAKVELPEEDVFILNTTTCYNCLDIKKSKLRKTPDGTVVIQIFEHVFHSDRIGIETLFKIPETKATTIYTVTGLDNDRDEFYTLYKESGFTGLKFEEVWSEDRNLA